MEERRSTVGFIGIGVGAIALLMAIVHFWAGPFSPQPSIERTVAEKAVAIRNSTIAALKGEKLKEEASATKIDLDRGLSIATGVMGGLAIIFGVLGFAKRESARVAGGAAILGGVALTFQFAVMALGAIIVAILVAAVISQIGIG